MWFPPDEVGQFFQPLSSYWRAKYSGGIFVMLSRLGRNGRPEVNFTVSEVMELSQALVEGRGNSGHVDKKKKKESPQRVREGRH